jgi:hypothetical protein
MAGRKKNFTTADGAIDKLFSPSQQAEPTQDTNDTQDMHDTNVTPITNKSNNTNETNISNNTNNLNTINDSDNTNSTYITKVKNKSKHYDKRGARAERFGLLLDEQLKDDLKHLSLANGDKSVNDFIITILIDYVEQEDNQKKLKQYRDLLQG